MKLIKSNSNLFPSLFSDLFDVEKFFEGFPKWNNDAWLPAVNIREDEKNYEIALAIPGLRKEDIKMEIENQVLTVSAENEKEKTEEKESYLRREYAYDSFSRSFSLPDNANEDAIESRYENGILKVSVGKKAIENKSGKKLLTVQ